MLLFFSIKKQQSHLQQLLEQTANQQKETSHKSQQELKQMSMKTQQDNNVVEQLKAIVAEKEAKVHRLEDEIQQLKLNVSAYFSPILIFLMDYCIKQLCFYGENIHKSWTVWSFLIGGSEKRLISAKIWIGFWYLTRSQCSLSQLMSGNSAPTLVTWHSWNWDIFCPLQFYFVAQSKKTSQAESQPS